MMDCWVAQRPHLKGLADKVRALFTMADEAYQQGRRNGDAVDYAAFSDWWPNSSPPRHLTSTSGNRQATMSGSDRVGLDILAEDRKATDDLREDGKAIIIEGKSVEAKEGWVRAPRH